jgi:hypothetical protein
MARKSHEVDVLRPHVICQLLGAFLQGAEGGWTSRLRGRELATPLKYWKGGLLGEH